MEVLYGEGIATHTGRESCGRERRRKGPIEALTAVRAGGLSSREIETTLRGADAVQTRRRPYPKQRYSDLPRDPARSEKPGMYGSILRENREIPCLPATRGVAGRIGKFKDVNR